MSQFHKHFHLSIKDSLRNFVLRFKYRNLHPSAFVLWGSRFLRFPDNIFVGAGTIVKGNCSICACNESAKIYIGENCTVGDYSYIYASGLIEIGDNCLIAPFAYLVDSDHQTNADSLVREQPLVVKSIKIGNDVWLGARVIVLGGVEIADGAVVAAGSVVRDNIGAFEIWAGVPARKVGERK